VDITHGLPLGDADQETEWLQGQHQITSSTTSSMLVKARGSGHAIAEERPALVAYGLKLGGEVGAKRRAATHVPCDQRAQAARNLPLISAGPARRPESSAARPEPRRTPD
jgi:hypothetical protein